jgi:hypothetical protein
MGSVHGWGDTIIFSLLFVSILSLVVADLNVNYGKNNAIGFTDDSGTNQRFITYQDTSKQQLEQGDVEFNAISGISLKSSWGIAKDFVTICWDFLTGGWIQEIVKSWGLGQVGTVLALGLRMIYFISLVFGLLYALFKIQL